MRPLSPQTGGPLRPIQVSAMPIKLIRPEIKAAGHLLGSLAQAFTF